MEREAEWYDRRKKLQQNMDDAAFALRGALDRWASHEPAGWSPPKVDAARVLQTFAVLTRERITSATILDALIVDALKMVKEAASERQALASKREDGRRVALKAEQKAAATRSQLAAFDTWLADHQDIERIVKNWGLGEKDLRTCANAHRELAELTSLKELLARRLLAAKALVTSKQSAIEAASLLGAEPW